MLGIFEQTPASETVLHPREDPEVLRLEAALQAAGERAEPAARAWRDYCVAHPDEVGVPFRRQKQQLYEAVIDTSWAVEDAAAQYKVALDEATVKATAAWDSIVRQQFIYDQPVIEQFIAVLQKHEQTAVEAELSGVSRALSVSKNFIASAEMIERLRYAKRALGLEE